MLRTLYRSTRNLAWFSCVVLCLSGTPPLLTTNAYADTLPVTTLPGEPVTRSIRNLQRKADRAFERGQYERAHRIYLKKLARKGDKHAHYMIGHLNEHGLGVPRDRPRALAWYALAAERGAADVKAIAERLMGELSASEQERADAIVAELWSRYGDRRLLVDAVQRDLRELKRRTGSLLGGGTSPSLVITEDGTRLGDQYYAALKARIEFRTRMLGGNVTLGQFEVIDAPEEDESDSEEP